MTEKKITKKVISKIAVKEIEKPAEKVDVKKESPEAEKYDGIRSKKPCFFCQNKSNPSYTDMATLRRFVTDRMKLVSHIKSNLCSKHQRVITKQVKYARHLALLPFSPRV